MDKRKFGLFFIAVLLGVFIGYVWSKVPGVAVLGDEEWFAYFFAGAVTTVLVVIIAIIGVALSRPLSDEVASEALIRRLQKQIQDSGG